MRRFVVVRQAARRGLAMVRRSRRRGAEGDVGGRDRRQQSELWKDQVPLMEDRDGRVHLLL